MNASLHRARLQRRAHWRRKSSAQKVAAVCRALDARQWSTAWAVGIRLGISTATARKYLGIAVSEGRAAAHPSLDWSKIGATEREFRLVRRSSPRG